MKRVIVMCAVFGLAALVTAYIAMAPFAADPGSPLAVLDAAAREVSAIQGRSVAVLATLGAGIVLALLAGLAVRESPTPYEYEGYSGRRTSRQVFVPEPDEGEKSPEGAGAAVDEAPLPAHRAPSSPEQRLAAMRQRASEAAPEPRPVAALPKGGTNPVVLVRKPRDPQASWFDDASWLGGLPRLGETPWPRDNAGTPLLFVAQIDLGEVARACPEMQLPAEGTLAFFLGAGMGTVVHIGDGPHDFTSPPADLPCAFDEDGAPFPARIGRLSRHFFPFWPVEPVGIKLPDALRAAHDKAAVAAANAAIDAELERSVPPRDHPFYAVGVGAPVETLWWFAVVHLADQFRDALDNAARPIALRRDAVTRARLALTALRSAPDVASIDIEDAEDDLAALEAELAQLEEQRGSLPQMIAALDSFCEGREPWATLTEDELDIVRELLPEAHELYGELLRDHVPGSLAQLATLCLRTMVTGAPEALEAMPEGALWRINRDYRLPPEGRHQMFGPQDGMDNGEGPDIMLLQLAWDDMMEWRWGQQGTYRFWIAAADAASGDWDRVRVTFEDIG